MSYVDDLLASYRRFVQLPWPPNVAHAQRVWMAIYPPEHERRLRLHVPEFATATKQAGHGWQLIDITTSFEEWMANHEYRDAYFESPELLEPALADYFDQLCDRVRTDLSRAEADENTVVGLLGAGSLFGLGTHVKVSALLADVNRAIQGRLLVFFPGEHEGNSYRLLDARDGWDYLATPITANGSRT